MAGDGSRRVQTLATSLRIQPVEDRGALKQFLRMPARLYAGDPHWVQPLLFERLEHLNPKKNPYFEHAEVAYWLALRGERPVGRISAQVDRLHLERYGDATGHFGFLEAEDDPEVFARLFETAEAWLRSPRHAPGDGALHALDQRRDRASDRGVRDPAVSDDGPRAALLRLPGRGRGLPQGQGPHRLRLRRRSTTAAAGQAHARASGQGRRAQLSPDRDAQLRGGAADHRRHLQRRLVGQLELRAHDARRGAPHGQEPEADRARRVRLDRRGGRRARGDDRDAAERQRGDRGSGRAPVAARLGRSSCGGSRCRAPAAPACRSWACARSTRAARAARRSHSA